MAILAGAPEALADPDQYLGARYDPLDDVTAESPVDRYAAVKALRFRGDLHGEAVREFVGVDLGRETKDQYSSNTAMARLAAMEKNMTSQTSK